MKSSLYVQPKSQLACGSDGPETHALPVLHGKLQGNTQHTQLHTIHTIQHKTQLHTIHNYTQYTITQLHNYTITQLHNYTITQYNNNNNNNNKQQQ